MELNKIAFKIKSTLKKSFGKSNNNNNKSTTSSKLTSDSTPDPPRWRNEEDDGDDDDDIEVELNVHKNNRSCAEDDENTNNREELSDDNKEMGADDRENDYAAAGSGGYNKPPPRNNTKRPNNKKKKSIYSNLPPANHQIYSYCTGVSVVGTVLTVNNTQNVTNNHQSATNNDNNNYGGSFERPYSPQVQALLRCSSPITRKDAMLVKNHIGNNWRIVALAIGCPKGKIDEFLDFYKFDKPGETMQRILNEWMQIEACYATIGRLLLALWYAREYDCADQLALAYHSARSE